MKSIQGELVGKIKRGYPGVLIAFLILISFGSFTVFAAEGDNKQTDCQYNPLEKGSSIDEALDGCLHDSSLVKAYDASIDTGLNPIVQNWINNISLYLGILAALSIVIGAFMMTLSAGEDEKITKAKDMIKWGIVGFIAVISSTAIISLVVKIIYSI